MRACMASTAEGSSACWWRVRTERRRVEARWSQRARVRGVGGSVSSSRRRTGVVDLEVGVGESTGVVGVAVWSMKGGRPRMAE